MSESQITIRRKRRLRGIHHLLAGLTERTKEYNPDRDETYEELIDDLEDVIQRVRNARAERNEDK